MIEFIISFILGLLIYRLGYEVGKFDGRLQACLDIKTTLRAKAVEALRPEDKDPA